MPHVQFDPQTVGWSQLYAATVDNNNNKQFGAGSSPYNVYQGRAFQRGTGIGSVFRSLFQRYLLPLGKQLGREGLATTHRVLSQVVEGGVPLNAAVKAETRAGVNNLLNRAQDRLTRDRKRRKDAPAAEEAQEGQGPIGGTTAKKRVRFAKSINSGEGLTVGRRYRTVLPPPPTTSNFLTNNISPKNKRRRRSRKQ